MSTIIPDSHKDLLTEPVVVTLATLMPDNQPQASVVWCDYDGRHILVNTVRSRQKAKNMSARPKVSVVAIDPDNPYRHLEVRGTVEEITEEGAVAHADKLTKLYLNKESYYGDLAPAEQADKETRVICKIKPTHAVTYGE